MNQDRYWHMVFCIMFLIPDMNNEIFFIFRKNQFFTPIFAFFCWRQQNFYPHFSRERVNRFRWNFYTSFLSLLRRAGTSNIYEICCFWKVIRKTENRHFSGVARLDKRPRNWKFFQVRVNIWGSGTFWMFTEQFCFLHQSI